MAKEYLIPIGLDFKGKDELAGAISSLEELKKKGGEVGRSIDEGMSKGVSASEKLDKELASSNDRLKEIKEMAKLAGKGFAEAFKTGDINKLEKELTKFKKVAENLTANVELNIDEEKLRIFTQQIEKAEDELDELRISLGLFKSVLDTLDTNSDEFRELTEYVVYLEEAISEFDDQLANNIQTQEEANSSMTNLSATFEEVYGDLQPMTTRLGELEDRLYELKLAGKENTKEFKDLQEEAVRLRRTITEVDASVDNFAKSSAKLDAVVDGVTGLVGAFTAVQGATALFGDENEELEKALIKVNGAMAVLQGMQAVTATLSKESAFNTVFLTKAKRSYNSAITSTTSLLGLQASATGGATLATKAFSLALKTIGIGLIITAIALLVEYWEDLTDAVDDFLPSGESVSKLFDSIKSYALGVGNAVLQYVIAPIKAMMHILNTGDISGGLDKFKQSVNVVANYNEGKRKQDLRNQEKYLNEKEKKAIEAEKRELERRKNRGENVFSEEQKLRKRELALMKKGSEEALAIQKEIEDESDKRTAEIRRKREQDAQKAEQLRQKRAEEAERKRQEEAERRAELQKKAEEQISTLTEELSEARIRNIKDEAERERAELLKTLDSKIKAIEDEKTLTAEAERKKNELLFELRTEREEKLKEFDEKVEAERLSLEIEKRKALLDVKEDSLDKEVQLLENAFEAERLAIKEQYKEDEAFQIELIKAKEESLAKAKKEIRLKYAKETLAEEEEIALLNIELAEKYAKKSERTELQKQVAIQEIKLEFAKRNLEALISSGVDENSVEVLRAKKLVDEMTTAFNEAVLANQNQKFDLLEFLGIGNGLSDAEKKRMVEGFDEIYKNLSAVTDFVVEQYSRQIDAKLESVEQLDDEINEMESRLEKEQELREDGFANEADSLERELELKKQAREEEVRQAEEIIKKKKAVEKTQMAIDTAIQLTNMVTASTEIFKSFAKLPFGIGIPLAVGVIASMFGAFTVAKVKAFQSINDQTQKFRKGGRIGGKRHNEGGTKFISETGERIELEKDEFVLRRERYKKYPKFVEAFNSGDFSKLSSSDIEVINLFNELNGIDVDISKAKSAGALLNKGETDGQTLKSIDKGIKDLNNKEEIFETDSERIIRRNNSTRRIRKN